MSARANLNHQQLKMFMSPAEIHASWAPLDGDRMNTESESWGSSSSSGSGSGSSSGNFGERGHESDDDLWDRKLDEAHEGNLARSIEEHGVKSPIRLGSIRGSMGLPQIVGGHHRLAVQTDLDPHELIPVLHDTDIYSARSGPSAKSYPYT
jgi:hypothetical protein